MVIYRGEHVAITGPSGSGKSTLLNLLGLLDKPTRGSIEIDGIDVGAAPERERAAVRAHRIGFVFQSFHLLPYRTSIENVMLAQVYADEPRRHRHAAAMAALAQVGLDHRAHALPTALSGGERQRVAIARALVNRPSLLMCDEPTGNLDTATTLELTDLLESLHRGRRHAGGDHPQPGGSGAGAAADRYPRRRASGHFQRYAGPTDRGPQAGTGPPGR